MKYDVKQIVYALERAAAGLQAQSDKLLAAMDFDAEFPAEDAQRMREAIELLTAEAAQPATKADMRVYDAIANKYTAEVVQPVALTDEQAYHLGLSAYEASVTRADLQSGAVKAFWQLTTIQQAGWVAKAARAAEAAPKQDVVARKEPSVVFDEAQFELDRAAMVASWKSAQPQQPAPIDMVLHCPKCGMQHIDGREPWVDNAVGQDKNLWTNPPHRSHLCHGCGHIWRPADVPTNGVAAVKTKGKNDAPL